LALRQRAIVGQLEHAAKQDRHIFESSAGALLDFWNYEMAEIGVRAAEVEMEFNFDHRITIFLRKDESPVRRSTHREAADGAANTPCGGISDLSRVLAPIHS